MTLRTLRAGAVTAVLDGIDLRYVGLGEVEVVRRIYVAVRDESWGTVEAQVGEVAVEESGGGFAVRFDARHTRPSMDFSWRGTITGRPDGRIVYDLEGRAARRMRYNRIGICVHHPCRESAGRPYRARTPQGEIAGELPLLIAPQRFENGVYIPLFASFDRLQVDLEMGGSVVFEFEGDLWETEDHRNWTDANFKSYSTPLARGFPHELREGEAFRQRLTVSLVGVPEQAEPESGPIRLTVEGAVARFPPVGLGMASQRRPLSPHEVELLKELGPAHLRGDVRLGDDDWRDMLTEAQEACERLGSPLELALHLRPEHRDDLGVLAEMLSPGPPVARVLVILADGATATPEETTPPELVELVRSVLTRVLPGTLFAGGTDLYFCELNRTRPQAESMDAVFYTLMPQMHAFSDLDFVENLEAQADTVASARALAAGKPVIVSPVTLKERFAYATASARVEEVFDDEPPRSVDPRQAMLLGAAWTAGSLKYLAEAGAASLTYYETTGWRGVAEVADGPPLPGKFPSRPGQAFPLYHVLADAAGWGGAEVLACASSAPLRASALAVRSNGGTAMLVANATDAPQQVAITPVSGHATIRRLNAATAELAAAEPGRFRATTSTLHAQGELVLRLAPFETTHIEIPG